MMFTHFLYYIDNLINMLNGFDFLMVGTFGAGKIVKFYIFVFNRESNYEEAALH